MTDEQESELGAFVRDATARMWAGEETDENTDAGPPPGVSDEAWARLDPEAQAELLALHAEDDDSAAGAGDPDAGIEADDADGEIPFSSQEELRTWSLAHPSEFRELAGMSLEAWVAAWDEAGDEEWLAMCRETGWPSDLRLTAADLQSFERIVTPDELGAAHSWTRTIQRSREKIAAGDKSGYW